MGRAVVVGGIVTCPVLFGATKHLQSTGRDAHKNPVTANNRKPAPRKDRDILRPRLWEWGCRMSNKKKNVHRKGS
jgi:hypothetical protein